jgi:hypothetical protein
MRTTMEWLAGKIKGGTTGCGNIRSLQPSKQCVLCKMAYSTEECVYCQNILPNHQICDSEKVVLEEI